MYESLMEEMAVEEQEAMEDCKMVAKQRVRWADMEEGQKGEKEEEGASGGKEQAVVPETQTERWVEQVTAAEEVRPERGREEETQ